MLSSCYYVEETKIPIEAKLLKLILLKSRQSGISSNKQKFKRIMSLRNILYGRNCVTFEMRVPLL